MGQRIIRVSGELLASILKLPETCKVVDMARDEKDGFWLDRTTLLLKVESPEFSDVEPGNVIPQVTPIHCTTDGQPKFAGGAWPAPPLMPAECKDDPLSNCVPFYFNGLTCNESAEMTLTVEVEKSVTGIPAVGLNAEPPPLPEPEPKKIKFREFL